MSYKPKVLEAAAGGTGVASTATFPSSGTLAVTTQIVTYQAATLTLTSSQVLNLRATPIQILAAPGSGKVIRPVCCDVKLNYGGTNAFTNGQNFALKHGGSGGTSMGTINVASMLGGTANAYTINNVMMGSNNVAATVLENAALFVQNSGATEISGNAAGDNTVTVTLLYYILSL